MKKIIALLVCVVLVSGCVDDGFKGDITVDDEGLTIDPAPVKIKKETVINIVADYLTDLLDFSEEQEIKNESIAQNASD